MKFHDDNQNNTQYVRIRFNSEKSDKEWKMKYFPGIITWTGQKDFHISLAMAEIIIKIQVQIVSLEIGKNYLKSDS